METVIRDFRLHESLQLPADAKILFPKPKMRARGFPIPVVSAGSTRSVAPRKDDDVAGRSSVLDRFLVVSARKATYLALPLTYLAAFELLLSGGMIGDAMSAIQGDQNQQPASVRDLLTQICSRNFFENAETSEYVPDGAVLHFYVTNLCNLECTHCYMSSGPLKPTGELSTRERLQVLDAFAKVYPKGRVTFTGGEALACTDIYALLDHAHDLGLQSDLYTNGVLLTRQMMNRLVPRLQLLQISLDGATEQTNDPIRGRGTFTKIVRAIRLANEFVSDSFAVRIAVTLTPANADDIEQNLRVLLADLNLDERIAISLGTSTALGRARNDPQLYSTADEMRALEAQVIHALTRQGVYSLPSFKTNNYQRTCGHGTAITVSATGDIFPCSIIEQPTVGTVRDVDVETKMRRISEYIVSSNVDNVEGCRHCDIRYLCGGLCRINNFNATGSYTVSGCTPQYKESQIRHLIRKYESFELSALQQDGALDDAGHLLSSSHS